MPSKQICPSSQHTLQHLSRHIGQSRAPGTHGENDDGFASIELVVVAVVKRRHPNMTKKRIAAIFMVFKFKGACKSYGSKYKTKPTSTKINCDNSGNCLILSPYNSFHKKTRCMTLGAKKWNNVAIGAVLACSANRDKHKKSRVWFPHSCADESLVSILNKKSGLETQTTNSMCHPVSEARLGC